MLVQLDAVAAAEIVDGLLKLFQAAEQEHLPFFRGDLVLIGVVVDNAPGVFLAQALLHVLLDIRCLALLVVNIVLNVGSVVGNDGAIADGIGVVVPVFMLHKAFHALDAVQNVLAGPHDGIAHLCGNIGGESRVSAHHIDGLELLVGIYDHRLSRSRGFGIFSGFFRESHGRNHRYQHGNNEKKWQKTLHLGLLSFFAILLSLIIITKCNHLSIPRKEFLQIILKNRPRWVRNWEYLDKNIRLFHIRHPRLPFGELLQTHFPPR